MTVPEMKPELPVVQYLPGVVAPDKEIGDAVHYFKYKTGFDKDGSVIVDEVSRYRKYSRHKTELAADRYRIRVVLGGKTATWPASTGHYLTKRGVIAILHNLHGMWNLVGERRTARRRESAKRLSQLNRAAQASEQAMANW